MVTAFATINNPSPSQFPVHLPTPNPTKRPITFPTSWPTAPTAIHPNGYGCSAVYPNCPSHCPYGASNTYQNPLTGCTFYCKSLSSADQCEVGGSGCTSSCRTAGQLAGIIIGSVSGIVLVLTLIVCCCIRSGCCNNPCKKSPPLAFQSELPNVNPLSANQGSNHIVANQQCWEIWRHDLWGTLHDRSFRFYYFIHNIDTFLPNPIPVIFYSSLMK